MINPTATLPGNTPIIVGAGQVTLPVPPDISRAASHADIAAEAARRAIADAAAAQDPVSRIDTVAAVRTFADSFPAWGSPFGGPDNFPGAIARRLGLRPRQCIYEIVGGQSPQTLVAEFCERLWAGDCRMVLLAGGEAIANMRAAQKAGASLDWNESADLPLENRGITGGDPLITRLEYEHGLMLPLQFYGLMETARRAERGLGTEAYRLEMARLFSAFSRVAAGNPHAAFPVFHDAADLAAPGAANPLLVSPYTKNLAAQDRVNQGAALLLTTVAEARDLGVDESKWIYLHGYAAAKEPVLLKRTHLGRSPAMRAALSGALAAAELGADAIDFFDLYSCFPVVVFNAREILGIGDEDPRPLTLTGGLPYFGGPGNNYSMHAIAAMVETLRAHRGSRGLVYANGGWMSKHAAGVYATEPPASPWRPRPGTQHPTAIDEAVAIDYRPEGAGTIESYIINYTKGNPESGIVIGRISATGKRFIAITAPGDGETLAALADGDPLGAPVLVRAHPRGNRIAFSEAALDRAAPRRPAGFRDAYRYCRVERRGHLLVVTICRPEVRNALNPPANDELEAVFDAYECDHTLRAAVITAEGGESFSAGNDLKYMAAGGAFWVPATGFGGVTNRPDRLKPLIAAVNGSALGGGLEIALACDIIVAAPHALFGLPEVRVGLIAAMGGIQRLTRQIGSKLAAEMLLTGMPIDAARALAAGLVNQVVPAEEVLPRALAIAEAIAQASPAAIRCTMDLAKQSARIASTDEAVANHYEAIDRMINSEDFYEGPRAFAQKRPPRWA